MNFHFITLSYRPTPKYSSNLDNYFPARRLTSRVVLTSRVLKSLGMLGSKYYGGALYLQIQLKSKSSNCYNCRRELSCTAI